jgi:The GLUG motif
VGRNLMGEVSQCSASGDTSGQWWIGGLVGYNDRGHLRQCYSGGTVRGDDAAGLVGASYKGSLSNCYSKASVCADYLAAGLVASTNSLVTNCYSCGMLDAPSLVGGLVADWAVQVTGCFWDREATGTTWSTGGTGLSTAAMKDPFTYMLAGWDFVGESGNGTDDIWIGFINDYPRLRWELEQASWGQ